MKDKLVNRLSFGATVTVFLYVAGFLWQYSYLGFITDHVGWIKIVTVDYLYLGVMAIVFTVPTFLMVIAVILFAFCYSESFVSLVRRCCLSFLFFIYEKRGKSCFYLNVDKLLNVGLSVKFFKFVFYLYVLLVLFVLPSKIMNNAKNHLAYRLSAGAVDTLCEREGDCYKGKLLYTNNNQFYFYTYDGSTDYRDGHLMVVGINNADVKLDWYPKWKSEIDQIVEANTSG